MITDHLHIIGNGTTVNRNNLATINLSDYVPSSDLKNIINTSKRHNKRMQNNIFNNIREHHHSNKTNNN